jgi:HEAT repeat protein
MTAVRRPGLAARLRMTDGQPVLPRLWIIGQAALVLVVLVCATWLIHVYVLRSRIPQESLSLAVAFLAMQVVSITLELAISFSIKRRRESIEERARRTQPVIRQYVASHLAGADHTAELLSLCKRHRDQVEICVAEALTALGGYGKQRIVALAGSLRLPDVWKARLSSRDTLRRKEAVEFLGFLGRSDLHSVFERCLSDPDLLVRAAACRALLDLPNPPDTARLFRLAIEGPLLLRTMVAGELRKHALDLSRKGLPEVGAETEQPSIIAGLGVMESWQRALHVPEVASLAVHPSAEVRAAAIRSLAFVETGGDIESLTLAALEDGSPEVRLAAMRTCSERRLLPAIPSLERQLHGDNQACALAACDALAALGEEGRAILEGCILDPNRALAAKALESLAGAPVGEGAVSA